MIELAGVTRRFGDKEVLKGIDLSVDRGATCVILGLSGSGKSVLMKHLIGLMRPDAGRIVIDGEDIAQLEGEALLRVRRKFGMVFQQSALFDSMTVGDNVAFPLREHTRLKRADIQERVAAKLAALNLADRQHAFPSELSGGMRKRVGLARALILDPTCILYDEPTTGLDPLTTDTVDAMIQEAGNSYDVTQVVISHDVGSALKVADKVAVIHEGRIVADESPQTLRQSAHPFVRRYMQAWFGKQ